MFLSETIINHGLKKTCDTSLEPNELSSIHVLHKANTAKYYIFYNVRLFSDTQTLGIRHPIVVSFPTCTLSREKATYPLSP